MLMVHFNARTLTPEIHECCMSGTMQSEGCGSMTEHLDRDVGAKSSLQRAET